ncbi:alpha/beta hydrolase-fold protein [Chitinophaga sp. MM2321]|uniref:alpha/beta hydrolase n=1 Tax=Chitinophaga sp. MM2321 TaxID=3137178 RepID=UPI0032D56845
MKIFHQRLFSRFILREVTMDVYHPGISQLPLLLVNDGQDLPEMLEQGMPAVFIVAIHAGPKRRLEYGTAAEADYLGQGNRAADYTRFIMEELLPFLEKEYSNVTFTRRAFAGFSLGGLSALDIVWQHPGIFSMAGVLSGALWWRSHELNEDYNDHDHRIMHRLIREGDYHPGLQFFFQCGTADETDDRNNNGIIDSIDDTQDLMQELQQKGYRMDTDIHYLEIAGGRHDTATWKTAFNTFLRLSYFS